MTKTGQFASNNLIKSLLVITCLALMSTPISALADKPAGGGSTCAAVEITGMSPSTTTAGNWVGVFSRITNCASGRQRYTVVFSARSACGEETVFSSGRVAFNGGEAKLVSATYPVAPDTCPGPCVVTVSVYAGSRLLADETATLTIQ
jgi:hypothetical protein